MNFLDVFKGVDYRKFCLGRGKFRNEKFRRLEIALSGKFACLIFAAGKLRHQNNFFLFNKIIQKN